jgi:hypothetical protein
VILKAIEQICYVYNMYNITKILIILICCYVNIVNSMIFEGDF